MGSEREYLYAEAGDSVWKRAGSDTLHVLSDGELLFDEEPKWRMFLISEY